ncbi:MAG: DUF3124 domain-containing protein [Pseudomonadota bacterium]
MMKKYGLTYLFFILLAWSYLPLFSFASETIELSKGQTIYVPAYSHIYIGDRERPFLLTITVSIRNVNLNHPITLTGVDYYETQGKFLKKMVDNPITLNPLESKRYIIAEKDNTGGSGANFIVEWRSEKAVNPPIVEAIMIGAKSGQGISFTSRGQVLVPLEK